MTVREIGGFFGLELAQGTPLHSQALALNSGRNALRVLLTARRLRRIHLPVYMCPSLVPAIREEGVEVAWYRITHDMEPADPLPEAADEAILLVNYFGLKNAVVQRYAKTHGNLIVDQCQALFASPPQCLGAIYSPRKFVGVADGGYLYTNCAVTSALPIDGSSERYQHCLQRIDAGARPAYSAFQRSEQLLEELAPAKMSHLTTAVLASIDYEAVAQRRRDNFNFLHHSLGRMNRLVLEFVEGSVPMVYPLVCDAAGLREHLVDHGVYVARYWPDPERLLPRNPVADMLSEQLFPLPIDQRYGEADMQRVVELVTGFLSATARTAQSG